METLYLVGAYGREATREDWFAGKDFKIYEGPYCSIRDLKQIKERYDSIELLNSACATVAVIYPL